MTVDELIQLMRTTTLAQVRAELQNLCASDLELIISFYRRAKER